LQSGVEPPHSPNKAAALPNKTPEPRGPGVIGKKTKRIDYLMKSISS
jgi:hypothetical protein